MKPAVSYAVIGDMVASRRTTDRVAAFQLVAEALDEVNRRFAGVVANNLILTQGIDELSGVLHHPAGILEMLNLLNIRIWPHRFRFGVGHGLVEPLSPRATSGRLDGPGFHLAAAALERARARDLPFALELPAVNIQPACRAAEAIGRLTRLAVDQWTPSTLQILRCLADNPDRELTQAELGAKLDKSQQAISKALRRTHHDDLKLAERAVHDLLIGTVDRSAEVS